MALADRNDIWETLGAGGYSAVNELLFGLPDWLVKKTGSSETVENLQRLRDENKLASGIGTGLGLVGGMLVPVGGLAKLGGKGLTLGAKALRGLKGADTALDLTRIGGLTGQLARAGQGLDKAGDILKATKGMRGALTRGASQAVPQAFFTSDDTSEFAKQALLGTALGGGAELGLNKLLPKLAGKASSALDGATIRGTAGPQTRRVIQDVTTGGMGRKSPTGRVLSRGEDAIHSLAEYIRRNKLTSLDDVAEKYMAESGVWNSISKVADDANLRPSDLLTRLEKDSRVQDILGSFGEDGEKMLTDILEKADKAKGWASVRKMLQTFSDKGMKSDDITKGYQGELAKIIREHFDDASMELVNKLDAVPDALSGKNLRDIKNAWRNASALGDAAARDMTNVAGATGGSDTFMKQQLGQMIGGGALGAGAGAVGGDDPMDAFAGAMVGAAGGAALNKALPKLINKGGAKLAGALGDISTRGASGELGQGVGRGIARIASRDTTPEPLTEEGVAIEAQAPGMGSVVDAAVTGNEEAIPSSIPTTPEDMADAADKRKLDSKYNMMVIGALRRDYYKNKMNEQGVSLPEYIIQTFKNTNGFDPSMSASIVWPTGDQAKKFLAQITARKTLEGLDTAKLFNYSPLQEKLGRYAGASQLDARRELEKIDAALFDMRKLATGATEDFALKGLSDKVKQAIASPSLSDEEKLQAVYETFRIYGYNPEMLTSYGV